MKNLSVSLLLLVGCAVALESSASQSWSYTYNTTGQVLTEDGPRTDVNDINTYTYDTQGHRTTFTNALGQVITYNSYDAAGRLLSVTDANGITTEFTYHVRGWLTTSTIKHPSGNTSLDATTTYSYDAVGQMTGMTLPNGSSLIFEYDDARRLTAVANGLGERIEYTLDLAGNRTAEVIKDTSGTIRYSIARAFDELSRVRLITGNNNQQDQLGYDVNDNHTATTDGNNHTTSQTYDALDRVSKIIDPAQNETVFTYNAQGQIDTVTDAKGLVTTYQYDVFGNLTSLISPDTGTTIFTYDNAGNRTSATDSRGVVVSYTYDALNRLTGIEYPASPSEDVSYTYDTSTSSNKGIGRLTRIVRGSQITSYTYNHLGLVTQKNNVINGINRAVKYEYNRAGQITKITYPSARIVFYGYDGQGRQNSISTRIGSAPVTTLLNSFAYLPFGPANSYTYGNGLTLNHDYDQDYRLQGIEVSGINPVLERDYSYDPVNNITAITNPLHTNKNQSFGYDPLNRLTSAQGVYGLLDYTYDAVGNRLTYSHDDGTVLHHDAYSYATDSHRLLGISRLTDNQPAGNRSFTYDDAGNRITGTGEDGSTHTHTYNHANRMDGVNVDSTAGATYAYNPLGQRISKTANATTEHYYYDEAGQLITVTDGSGNPQREYIYLNNQPVAFIANSAIYYIHTDHLNTPQVVTDQNQQVVWMGDYQPFGKLIDNSQTNSIELYSRFPGQYLDSETGLYYNYFRDYDPSIGRYIQSDPIGLNGGINTYAYVAGNPLKFIDSKGLAYSPVGEHKLASFSPFETAFNYRCKSAEEINIEAHALAGQLAGFMTGGLAGAFTGALIGGGTGAIAMGEDLSPHQSSYNDALVNSVVQPGGVNGNVAAAAADVMLTNVLPDGDSTGKASAVGALIGGVVGGKNGYMAGGLYPWLVDLFKNMLEDENQKFGCSCE